MKKLNAIELEELLREKNLRPTRARMAILSLFQEDDVNHLSCEEIVKIVRRRHPAIGQATVYQNVNLLADKGLLVRFTGPNGVLLHDGTRGHHHHLVCKRCGEITEVLIEGHCDNLVPYPYREEDDISQWSIDGVCIEFFGVCPACIAARKRRIANLV